MRDWKHDLSLRAVKLLNVALITLPFMICWFGYYADRVAFAMGGWNEWMIVFLFMVLYFTFGRVYDALLECTEETGISKSSFSGECI